jgi:hypothetical protein
MPDPQCPNFQGKVCPLCGLLVPPEQCPLNETLQLEGQPIGAVTAAGTCEGGEVCEACQ